MKRKGSAEWKGDLKQGRGTLSSESGALSHVPYSAHSRFAEGKETNPEELIVAAHAACFSMAFSAQLGNAGLTPDWIRTQAIADFDKLEAGWTVTGIRLEMRARVPGATEAVFQQVAEAAGKTCPVSRLLNTKITVAATLEA